MLQFNIVWASICFYKLEEFSNFKNCTEITNLIIMLCYLHFFRFHFFNDMFSKLKDFETTS